MPVEGTFMENPFFDHPILYSPYEIPDRHWELDKDTKQPTQRIINKRRPADFYTPIPKPKKRKDTHVKQTTLGFSDTEDLLSTENQEYCAAAIINQVRACVCAWRRIPDPSKWGVTPETARLLQHWRYQSHSDSARIRPFFCQIEAAETAIWLTEVAPNVKE
jgi:type III restriction enzyme